MSIINKNTENFIINCKKKFGIEYDYSNIMYVKQFLQFTHKTF